MAITNHQSPAAYTPSDNPIIWTFSSNQTAQPNFVYIVKVFINDVQVKSEFAFPENGIYARTDASDYASNACSLPTISNDLIVDANNYCKVKIQVIEFYGSTPAEGASWTSSNVVAWKAKMTDEDYIDWDPADYTFGTSAKWLTNFPSTLYSPKVAATGEQIRLMCINNLNTVNLIFRLYDADGNQISNGTYGFTATSYRLCIVNATPSVIVNESIGITQADFDAASYYTVEDNLDLVPFRIDIDTDCKFSTYKRFHFIGQWGSPESFSFNLISRESGSIKSFGYEQEFGQWDGNQFEFNKEQGTIIDYAKIVDKKLTVESDWVPEVIQHYIIENMLCVPVVYQELSETSIVKRKLMNASYEKKIQENDMLFNIVLEVGLRSYNSMIV
jgi:hypothetical protein